MGTWTSDWRRKMCSPSSCGKSSTLRLCRRSKLRIGRGETIGSKQTLEDDNEAVIEEEDEEEDGEEEPWEGEGSGAWVPGQGVYVDHAAIMDIIIQHLSYPGE
jgi:hypothetical protein